MMMMMSRSCLGLLLLALCWLHSHRLCRAWTTGRATYYGGPSVLGDTYDASRGKGSFGILAFGSCGYTNGDGSLLFPADMYAAAADANTDYPGSCGRCYEVKCVDGHVYDDPHTPIKIINGSFNGDHWRPYLPAINSNLKDTHGRTWPGNPGASQGDLIVKCWQSSKTLRVRVADSCPCIQVLKDGDPGVRKGGEIRRQQWCCGGEPHFDLSYYAFEQLAHPLYGAMMLQFRPVDCNSGAELNLNPGFVSKTIFHNVPQPGWGVYTDKTQSTQLSVPGIAPDRSGALCTTMAPGGSLSFRCRFCFRYGYQPFASASAVQFWIKPNSGSSNPYVSSTPDGQLPGLKLFLLEEESKEYCGHEPVLGRSVSAEQTSGGWFKVKLPLSLFKCGNGLVSLNQLDNLAFQNIAERNAVFCIADLQIV